MPVVLLSGGLDSTTLLAYVKSSSANPDIHALGFIYGQKHVAELTAARAVASFYNVKLTILNLPSEPFVGGELTDPDKPVTQGASYSEQRISRPVATVVPFRNGTFISIAAAYSQAHSLGMVYYGAHADDAARWAYPDCTPEFVQAMQKAVKIGTYQAVGLLAPFNTLTKAAIVTLGNKLNVPFELTWSCYVGGKEHCGTCATCISRQQAFADAGVSDPTVYESDPKMT